jgi:HEPN domain-containing protein
MRKSILIWWKQAERDLLTAKNSFTSKDYYASVFWCQQSIEKGFKALSLKKLKEIPQGHSLVHLAKVLKAPDTVLSKSRILNSEYITTRYPDATDESPSELYDEEKAKSQIKNTEEIIQWLKNQIQ